MKIEIINEMQGKDLRYTMFIDGREEMTFWLGEDAYIHRELVCKLIGDSTYIFLRDKGIIPK